MAKKSTAIVAKSETETVPEATPSVTADTAMDRPDPTLLGVRMPLSVTFAAFKQVTDAWRACLLELSIAVKSKGIKAVKAPEVLSETPTINA
jgi:hypothetical protein